MKPEEISFDTPLVTDQLDPALSTQNEQSSQRPNDLQSFGAFNELPTDYSTISFGTPLHKTPVAHQAEVTPIAPKTAAPASFPQPINRRAETLKPVWATPRVESKPQNIQLVPRLERPISQMPVVVSRQPEMLTTPDATEVRKRKLSEVVREIRAPKVSFSLPKIKSLNLKFNNRLLLGGVGVLVIGLIVLSSFAIFRSPKTIKIVEKGSSLPVSSSTAKASEAQLSDSTSATLSSPATTASSTSSSKVAPFTPVVPAGEEQLADLGPSAYDSVHQVYTFHDLYLAQPLQLSEQVLPTGYGDTAETVTYIAKALKATTVVPLASGTAYMGTVSSTQVQTVVYSSQGLLIMIKSSYPHTAAEWAQYLETLQ
jgi:hypothetical protein